MSLCSSHIAKKCCTLLPSQHESFMPAMATVIATTIQKQYPTWYAGMPRDWSMSRKGSRKTGFVNKGALSGPSAHLVWFSAETGQISIPVTPTTPSFPCPNLSHFNFFKWIWTIWSFDRLPTATSPYAKSVAALKDMMMMPVTVSQPKKTPKACKLLLTLLHHLALRNHKAPL